MKLQIADRLCSLCECTELEEFLKTSGNDINIKAFNFTCDVDGLNILTIQYSETKSNDELYCATFTVNDMYLVSSVIILDNEPVDKSKNKSNQNSLEWFQDFMKKS